MLYCNHNKGNGQPKGRKENKTKIYKLNNGRYIVARYDDKNGSYYAPMNSEEKKLTGCHTYTAKGIEGLGVHSYSTRAAAKRWAESQGYEIEKDD